MTPEELDKLLAGPTVESLFEHPNVEDVDLSGPPKYPGQRYDLRCGECTALMTLRDSNKYPKPFYGCTRFPECRGTHGAHKDGTPLGKPANKDTKAHRIWAHSVFDQVWKQKLVTHRGAAYGWMRQVMGLSITQAHIGEFGIEQCAKLVELVYRDYPTLLQNRHERLVYGEDLLDKLGGEAPEYDEPEKPDENALPDKWDEDRDWNDFV